MGSKEGGAPSRVEPTLEPLMPQHNDLSQSLLPLDQDSTLIAVIQMSQSNWLVAALVPGLGRHPLKKIKSDEAVLLRRWQDQAADPHRTAGEGSRSGQERHGRSAGSRCRDWH